VCYVCQPFGLVPCLEDGDFILYGKFSTTYTPSFKMTTI
jgi:hypothetical protein